MTQPKKINPAEEGIGITGGTMRDGRRAPDALLEGRHLYRRIFIRLSTPQETLTCSPIKDRKDFAQRVSIIENWFNSIVRSGNFVLTFSAMQVTDEEADEIEHNSLHPQEPATRVQPR